MIDRDGRTVAWPDLDHRAIAQIAGRLGLWEPTFVAEPVALRADLPQREYGCMLRRHGYGVVSRWEAEEVEGALETAIVASGRV